MAIVPLKWGKWCDCQNIDLIFPDNCSVEIAVSDELTKLKSLEPSTEITLCYNYSRNQWFAKKICIVLEDASRPSKLSRIVDSLISFFYDKGVDPSNITFVISNGAHGPSSESDIKKKYGATLFNFSVINHNPFNMLADTGIKLGQNTIKVNRFYYEADIKIAVGTVMQHSFAGFSSGCKLILPGICDLHSLSYIHKFVMMGLIKPDINPNTNKFRKIIEDNVLEIGLDSYIGVVCDPDGTPINIYQGDPVDAQRNAASFANDCYTVNLNKAYDVLVLNSYPKDTEFIQSDSAFTCLRYTNKIPLKKDGKIVMLSYSKNGYGTHYLFNPGMMLHNKPKTKPGLEKYKIFCVSPNITQNQFHHMYSDSYVFSNNWIDILPYLDLEYSDSSVAILPYAPLQVIQCPS